INLKFLFGNRWAIFSFLPVMRLSMQMTLWPLPIRKLHRCDPIKPAPPVISIFNFYPPGTRLCIQRRILSHLPRVPERQAKPGPLHRLFRYPENPPYSNPMNYIPPADEAESGNIPR